MALAIARKDNFFGKMGATTGQRIFLPNLANAKTYALYGRGFRKIVIR